MSSFANINLELRSRQSVGDEKRKKKEVNLRFTPVVKFKVK